MSAVCSQSYRQRQLPQTPAEIVACSKARNLKSLTTCGSCRAGHRRLGFQPSAAECGQSVEQSLGAAGCQEGNAALHSGCILTLPPVTLVWLAFA